MRGQACFSQGKIQEAMKEYNAAIARWPKYPRGEGLQRAIRVYAPAASMQRRRVYNGGAGAEMNGWLFLTAR
jgi:hypothetical protein